MAADDYTASGLGYYAMTVGPTQYPSLPWLVFQRTDTIKRLSAGSTEVMSIECRYTWYMVKAKTVAKLQCVILPVY